jgi:trimeric autotransporter adhesin
LDAFVGESDGNIKYFENNRLIIFEAAAWTKNTEPIASDFVQLKDDFDVNTDGSIAAKRLIVNAGHTLTMTTGSIELKENFINNGNAFTQTGGTVTLNGSSAQAISGDNSFSNLVVNNSAGVTLSDATTVTGKLTLSSGVLASGGNLTLQSDASGTAYIVDGGGSVSGNVTVQRHIKDNSGEVWGQSFNSTGYRYLSSPINGLTVAGITGFTSEITDAAVFNTNWNQVMPTAFPNIFTYDESRITASTGDAGSFVKGWEVPTAATDVLPNGEGFILNIPTGNTVSFTGTLNDGDITVPVTLGAETQSGWALLGNPYPSPLNRRYARSEAGRQLCLRGRERLPEGALLPTQQA